MSTMVTAEAAAVFSALKKGFVHRRSHEAVGEQCARPVRIPLGGVIGVAAELMP